MTYYAKIENNIVTTVIVCDSEEIKKYKGVWVETKPDKTLRKNYAGIGYTFDSDLDVFIPPKRFESWILDTEKCRYMPPMPNPDPKNYEWSEPHKKWVKTEDR